MQHPPRVALYARVSTSKQDELNQVPILTEYAASRGYEVTKLYTDQASGCNPHRPAWVELMNDARKHRFDIIIAVRLDRVMRSVAHLLKVIDELERLNIKLEMVDIGRLDFDSATGRLINTLIAAIAQWERNIICERTRQALAEKRKQGIIGGRPKKPINIELAASLRYQGLSLSETAARLGCTRSDLNNRRALIWKEMDKLRLEDELKKGGDQ